MIFLFGKARYLDINYDQNQINAQEGSKLNMRHHIFAVPLKVSSADNTFVPAMNAETSA